MAKFLTINIGNSHTTIAVFKNNQNFRQYCIPTGDKYEKLLSKVFLDPPEAVIICSVAPLATRRFIRALKRFSSIKPLLLGKDISIPLKNEYTKPGQLGEDRLVTSFAAIIRYGAPLIVVDCGTALTINVVSADRSFRGGIILPGIEMSLKALSLYTAQLPFLERIGKKHVLIGKTTRECIISGISNGFAAMVDGLIVKIKSVLGKKTIVIGTGGGINSIAPLTKQINKIDNLLLHYGLYALLHTHLKKPKNKKNLA